ncbi:MAG: glycosyltransferase [Lentisphaerae bacterium]|nr:glycosyltransferase [Lentisphaerota bacterium]MBT4821787.1 glycosyltransferase [Lentisphaerota bacterium]MBT7059449.1 glycosyltransferase [Lentisphaerota bacterium]MBT7847833.1 glycosyltransferase [Lentisphaerota bacterium]
MNVDCVIIGLNSEATLDDCIKSVVESDYASGDIRVYYADGGSSDKSIEIAQRYENVQVINVEAEYPTPGRQRNSGWRAGSAPLIQFLDSDTVLHPQWLARAAEALGQEEVGAVRGGLRERHPEASVYNWIGNLEWNMPPGECAEFGGNVVVRRDALEKTTGYDDDLVVGEDPEISQRLRKDGWRILQLDAPMATHDLGMTRLSQYWKRSFRTGYGYAVVAARHRKDGEGFWLYECGRIIARGGGSLALAVLALLGTLLNPMALALLLPALFLLLYPRLCRIGHFMTLKELERPAAKRYALHCSLVVVPEFLGMTRYAAGALVGRPLRNRRRKLRTRATKAVAALLGLALITLSSGCRWRSPDPDEFGPEPTPAGVVRKTFHTGREPRPQPSIPQPNIGPVEAPFIGPKLPPGYSTVKTGPDGLPPPPIPGVSVSTYTPPTPAQPAPIPAQLTRGNDLTDLQKVTAFSRDVSGVYLLGPGDILDLKVWDHTELSDSNIVVGPDGTISVLRIGILKVAERSLDSVTKEISDKYSHLYEDPEVNIAIRHYANNRVYVLGRVRTPGIVEFPGGGTLVEAISRVGGVASAPGERSSTRCAVIRGQQQPVWIDLSKLLQDGDMSLNVRLKNHDVVFVPSTKDARVYVVGEVRTPGPHVLKEDFTYMDAIMLSGGPSRGANIKQTFILRMGEEGETATLVKVNLAAVLKGGRQDQNYLLQDRDILFVPRTKLLKFNDTVTMLIPGLQFFNMSLEALEKLGVLAELRQSLWGQSGFVND